MGSDEIGASLGLSENKVSVSVKSRWLSAYDHFLGRKVEKKGLETEREVTTHRVVNTALNDVIAKAAAVAGDTINRELSENPEAARRMLSGLARAVRGVDNLESVLNYGLEDLSHRQIQNNAEMDVTLNADFLERFESYAERASTEEARLKWGSILSSEIRNPGTFSNRAMRVLDEIDKSDAELFQQFCAHRLGDNVPHLLTALTSHEQVRLERADLLISSELSYYQTFREEKLQGKKIWFANFGDFGLSIPFDIDLPFTKRRFDDSPHFLDHEGAPNFRIYWLSPVGRAVASLIDVDELTTAERFRSLIAAQVGSEEVHLLRRNSAGNVFVL
ncbi:hypothetical protein GGQ64_002415 [Rhizobium azooxidifex]|uniref:DUF2806 domain-containing protein n=1 Tax=Mycoplana azooxidifex TaxID=1636188 RepID=A0A7W6GKS9_9HYPH|nr:DUF2806 domain-containing protein [Mycoplana azooxidifex]MBB3977209.1 hypothetical protein [Mycoplana azooxidifex]